MTFHEDILKVFQVSSYRVDSIVLGIATATYKVQRGITQNIYIPELWFLRSAHRLMLVNISMTFHEDILNGFQVTERMALHSVLGIAVLCQQGYYRAHYVNRFRDLLRAVQYCYNKAKVRVVQRFGCPMKTNVDKQC